MSQAKDLDPNERSIIMNIYKFEHRNDLFTLITEKEISHVYVVSQMVGIESVSYTSNGHPTEAHAYKAMKSALRRLDRQLIAASGQVIAVQKAA